MVPRLCCVKSDCRRKYSQLRQNLAIVGSRGTTLHCEADLREEISDLMSSMWVTKQAGCQALDTNVCSESSEFMNCIVD